MQTYSKNACLDEESPTEFNEFNSRSSVPASPSEVAEKPFEAPGSVKRGGHGGAGKSRAGLKEACAAGG